MRLDELKTNTEYFIYNLTSKQYGQNKIKYIMDLIDYEGNN